MRSTFVAGIAARDGAPVAASQVMARVRRAPYRDRYTVDSEYRISRVESSPPNEAPFAPGPHGWLNWVAAQFGFPQRETVHPDSVVIQPSWEEFVLYSDANIDGTWLELGPYDLVFLEPLQARNLGAARRAMLLRSWDHLPDDRPGDMSSRTTSRPTSAATSGTSWRRSSGSRSRDVSAPEGGFARAYPRSAASDRARSGSDS
jgi:hypothetical protein